MRFKVTIEYWYENTEDAKPEVIESLHEMAMERATSMIAEGYHSGELCASYNDSEFYGWWNYKREENP